MLLLHTFLLNYRLILLNVLIYDLITTEIVIANDFDKSLSYSSSSSLSLATMMTEPNSSSSSSVQISSIFMCDKNNSDSNNNSNIHDSNYYYNYSNIGDNDNDAVAAAGIAGTAVDNMGASAGPVAFDGDNCTAINENVDNFQNDDNADDYYQNQIAFMAAAYRNMSGETFQQHDLLSTTLMKNSTVKMSNWLPTTTTAAPSSSSSSSASAVSRPLSSSLAPSSSSSSLQSPLLQHNSKWQRILSRPKRFLAFPEGSSFSVAVCFTVGIIGNVRYDYMSYGLNWGVAYDLPNATWVLLNLHGLKRRPVPTTVLRRRSRRSLYNEIEMVVDNMGYNGRDCVLRALCESRQYFSKTKMGMIGEMLRVIFSLPKQRIFTRELRENSDIELYDHAYRKGRSTDCSQQYDCSFSLLELAFGKYSNPPPGYYA